MADTNVQTAVREKYGAIATSVKTSKDKAGCCGPTSGGGGDPITSNLYSDAETGDPPPGAAAPPPGWGKPTALLPPEPGQTVLAPRSGGGVALVLSAQR